MCLWLVATKTDVWSWNLDTGLSDAAVLETTSIAVTFKEEAHVNHSNAESGVRAISETLATCYRFLLSQCLSLLSDVSGNAYANQSRIPGIRVASRGDAGDRQITSNIAWQNGVSTT